MTNEEFSQGFDTLVNSYAFSPAFGDDDTLQALVFDEYEKSVFLTKAQKELVLSIYNGKNPYGESFEETEEQRRYLAPLVSEDTITPLEGSSFMPTGMGNDSTFFILPDDLWMITYESVTVSNGDCADLTTLEVVPVTQDEYHRLRKNPFRGASNRRALRLDLSDDTIEIICKYEVESYYLRYMRKLRPIILTELPDGLTIDGLSPALSCELPETLHEKILENAVALAVQSKQMNRISNS